MAFLLRLPAQLYSSTVMASLLVLKGYADALLCGPVEHYKPHLELLVQIFGISSGNDLLATLTALLVDQGVYFVCDGHINFNHTSEEVAEIAMMAATRVKQFRITPKIALLSHSNFGFCPSGSSEKNAKGF